MDVRVCEAVDKRVVQDDRVRWDQGRGLWWGGVDLRGGWCCGWDLWTDGSAGGYQGDDALGWGIPASAL